MSEETRELFERQESKLSAQSAAFMKYLVKKGLISDATIQDPDVRKAKQEKQRVMFHNTQLLLKHYRNIKWVLECFPDTVAEDLDMPYHSLDTLLDGIDMQLSLENTKLQHRLQSLHKSRLMMDRLNEALTMLQKKPGNGELMYQVIYLTYISPEQMKHEQILSEINISGRQYYKLRQQAFTLLSIRLWSAPAAQMDSWIEVMTLLEMF